MRNPAAAARLLAELRSADSVAALADLGAWLRELAHLTDRDDAVHAEILALVQEAGDPHAARLMAGYTVRPDRKQAARPAWQPVDTYLTNSLQVLNESAASLLERAASDASHRPAAAAAAARTLHACRMLAKACLLRYARVPADAWRTAYAVHRLAESSGCSILPVRLHAGHRTTTTANQELLRLLMLQCSAPEMVPPAQIEVADWVTEQLGGDFTLRPPGTTDNPFCFDGSGEAPPQRSAQADPALRYFGPGMAYEALQRMYGQASAAGGGDAKDKAAEDKGRDVRLSALQHLLAFWGEKAPYTPPERTEAAGEVRVIHGYSQAWQQLSSAGKNLSELTLAEDGDVPLEAPEKWTLLDKGGSELGLHIPQPSSDCVRCGDVVALATDFGEGWWLGLVRSMRAPTTGAGMDATVHVISQHPQALQARTVVEEAEERGVTEHAARQFSYAMERVIVVSDGSTTSQPANVLLPPASWRAGGKLEVAISGVQRHLRCVRMLRRGEDYVRATFDWADSA